MGEIATWILLVLGSFVAVTGAIGVLRFPDFYSRLHPAGTGDTLAQFLIMVGLLPQTDHPLNAAKLVLITILLFITTPTATQNQFRADSLETSARVWWYS